jgi:hypothetical protein
MLILFKRINIFWNRVRISKLGGREGTLSASGWWGFLDIRFESHEKLLEGLDVGC